MQTIQQTYTIQEQFELMLCNWICEFRALPKEIFFFSYQYLKKLSLRCIEVEIFSVLNEMRASRTAQ